MALNYYKDGMHFLFPEIHSLGRTGSGVVCPTECPVIYYLVALLWQVFGYREYIYRLLEMVITFLSLYALYKTVIILTGNHFWATITALLLFTSPLFVSYSVSFIMDGTAVCFILLAWYFFVKYYQRKKLLCYYTSIFFFLLAGLIKVTSLIAFGPLIGVLLYELVKRPPVEQKIFIKPFIQTIPICLMALIIYRWILYFRWASGYNNPVNYLGYPTPIWTLNKAYITKIFHQVLYSWQPQYCSLTLMVIVVFLFLVLIVNVRKLNRFYTWLVVSIFTGNIIYLVLWFEYLNAHDYYLICTLLIIPAILIAFILFIKNSKPQLFNSRLLKLSAVILLACNIYYCSVVVNARFGINKPWTNKNLVLSKQCQSDWNWLNWDYEHNLKAFETITPYLRSIGVNRDDRVFSFSDESLIISLYLMDQKGFTQSGFIDLKDNDRMTKFISLGAKYLIVSNPSDLNLPWLQPYLKEKIGTYQNVAIFDLRHI